MGEAEDVRALFAAAGTYGLARERPDLERHPAGRVRAPRAHRRGRLTMRQEKARAIVLASRPLGEADRILRLYTRELGRVDAVVKGVRKTTSRWGGRLEPFNVCDLVLYPGRSLLHRHASPARRRLPATVERS